MAREDDAISNAITATELEIAGAAWGNEETDALDETGDRSLENTGDGLEGQHEPDEDDDLDDDESDEDDEGEGKPEPKPAGDKPVEEPKKNDLDIPEGRVPPGQYRKVAERARAAETERDALKAQLNDRLELVMREISDLKRAPRGDIKPQEPPKPEVVPDIFEDPKGFAEYMQKGFNTELAKRDAQLQNQRVETSMAIAHAFHKDTFEKAYSAVGQLNPQDPDARATVQRIMASPNPGEALVAWHKREQTRAEVGDDFVAYRDRIAKETRENLLNDPEFKKQIVASLRQDAANGDDGQPRTTTRLPRSLARAGGSNLGADRGDSGYSDGSDQAVADAAWR